MTIREISQLCDVPPTTVHRAIKTPDKVKPEILQKINAVLLSPYSAESPLKKIYIVLPYLNNYHNLFIIHVNRLLSKHNILVTPFITDENPVVEEEFLKNLTLSSRIGLMWCPTSSKVKLPFLKTKQSRQTPVLFLYRHLADEKEDLYISQNNSEGIEIAMKGFADCKNILLINGYASSLTTAFERRVKFQELLTPDINGDIIEADFNDWKSAYHSIKNHSVDISQYDAVISTNELLTCGLVQALNEQNLSIDKDIKVATFDYSPVFEAMSIRCIHFSAEEMAQHAVDMILEKSLNPHFTASRSVSPNIK